MRRIGGETENERDNFQKKKEKEKRKKEKKEQKKKKKKYFWSGLFGFYDISIFVGHQMPNSFYNK